MVAVPARDAQVRLRSPSGGLQWRRRYLCVDGARAVGGPAQQARHVASRHCRRILPLRRRRYHASALRHIGRRGPEGHRSRLREGGGAPVDRYSGRPFCHAEPRNGQGGRPVRPDHLVWFVVLAVMGAVCIAQEPRVLAAFNPIYGANVSLSQRPDRAHRSGPRVPRRHGSRGSLCRSRALRSQADPGRLAGLGAARAHTQLLGTGRARCSANRRRSRIHSFLCSRAGRCGRSYFSPPWPQ